MLTLGALLDHDRPVRGPRNSEPSHQSPPAISTAVRSQGLMARRLGRRQKWSTGAQHMPSLHSKAIHDVAVPFGRSSTVRKVGSAHLFTASSKDIPLHLTSDGAPRQAAIEQTAQKSSSKIWGKDPGVELCALLLVEVGGPVTLLPAMSLFFLRAPCTSPSVACL